MTRFLARWAAASIGLGVIGGITASLPAATIGARGGVAWAAPLGIGDPAPPIAVKSFVKGAPVRKFEKGKVSVVEFWATWCGPCRESIPHLTELAKKYPQVTFVGVSIFEEDQAQVVPFVKEMGAHMDYHVAMDRVPAGARPENGAMASHWMVAADLDTIPTAFIIGKDGRIAWIGRPMEMAGPLAKITAGAWDFAQARSEFQQKKRDEKLIEEAQDEMTKAAQTGDVRQILAVVDKYIAASPGLERDGLGMAKFSILRDIGQAKGSDDAARLYGKHLVEDVFKDDADSLSQLAWSIVGSDAKLKTTPALSVLALEASKRADAIDASKDSDVADTLAAALFANGDKAGAVAAETRAVKLLANGDPDTRAKMKSELAAYQKGEAPTN